MSQLPLETRQILRHEIEKWRQEGLISPALAALLDKRYQPVVPPPLPTPSLPAVSPAEPPLPTAPAPRPTLAQTLLSETSIQIALYLGAFFVIAAALILAALVAYLRLPILLGVAFLFGGAALALKKRLPQPSFILWLVFSALLPISAQVTADLLKLSNRPLSAFWMVVFFSMTLLWGFSTWLYTARFFSLAAFGALAAGAWFCANLFEPQPELYLFFLMLAALLGMLGAGLLKTWQKAAFALPLFLFLQLFVLGLLLLSSGSVFLNLLEPARPAWWLFAALTWLTAFLFFTASDLVNAFPVFPFLAAGVLLPVAGLALKEFDPGNFWLALGGWLWGLLLASSGEIASFFPFQKIKQNALPLLLISLPLFLLGGLWGFIESEWLGFGLFAASGLLLTLLQIHKNRWWLWLTGLLCLLVAYFAFFNLPPIARLEPEPLYLILAALAALVFAELPFPADFKHAPGWRWPPRLYQLLLLAAASLGALFSGVDAPEKAALTFGCLACLSLLFALKFHQPWLGALFSGYTTLVVIYLLQVYSLETWLPALTILSVTFYLLGLALTWQTTARGWSNLFRWSGLLLGGYLALAAWSYPGTGAGWYLAPLVALFACETFGRFAWLELLTDLIACLGLAYLLTEMRVTNPNAYLMGFSVILLSLEAFFARTLSNRQVWGWLPRWVGLALALSDALLLLGNWHSASGLDLAISLTYALALLGYALLYREPRLAYAYFAVLPATLLTAAGLAGLENWTGPLIALATLIYVLSWLDKPLGWGQVRRFSGLALATLTALSAPFESSGLWSSLPVALAATLWALEAFRRRNVWLGFPANALYLLAYFMILLELQVDQPQFFSVGTALLGMLMHYLLRRAGSNTGAFLTGMVSQLVLLSTTYIQMVSTDSLAYFAALFFQSLVVLVYGLVIRSRSLVLTPIAFVVLGVVTVVFSVLKGIATVLLIGCTGILFIVLGIFAVLMRERLSELRDRLSDWQA